MGKKERGLAIYFGIVSALMLIFIIPLEMLKKYKDIEWHTGQVLIIVGAGLLFGALVLVATLLFFKNKEKLLKIKSRDRIHKPLPKHMWLVWPILSLCYLPIYLAYFPGNCCYDFLPQVGQLLYGPLNDHHPLIHTLILKFFMDLGKNHLGSMSAGFAVFCFLQMLFMAGILAICIIKTSIVTGRRSTLYILTGLFAFYPFNWYLSISITKDIPFSMGVLLFLTCILSILKSRKGQKKISDWVGLFLSGLLIMIFRNNGRYALLFFLGILFFVMIFGKAKRKLYFKLLVNTGLSFAIGMIIIVGVKKVTGAEGGDKREMFSVPLQQIARAVNYKYDELSPDFIEEVEKLIWPSSLYSYRPDISDPVKRDAISWEILHRPQNTLNTYLTLLKAYPSEYVNAYIELYAGFLNPLDQTHRYINDKGDGVPIGLHYVQTVFYDEAVEKGFWQKPVSMGLHAAYEWYANNDIYIKVPILALLFVPGSFLWFYLYFAGLCVYRQKKYLLIPMALIMGYFITLFLGPTVQLRYIYPVMICVPVLISFFRIKNEK